MTDDTLTTQPGPLEQFALERNYDEKRDGAVIFDTNDYFAFAREQDAERDRLCKVNAQLLAALEATPCTGGVYEYGEHVYESGQCDALSPNAKKCRRCTAITEAKAGA